MGPSQLARLRELMALGGEPAAFLQARPAVPRRCVLEPEAQAAAIHGSRTGQMWPSLGRQLEGATASLIASTALDATRDTASVPLDGCQPRERAGRRAT